MPTRQQCERLRELGYPQTYRLRHEIVWNINHDELVWLDVDPDAIDAGLNHLDCHVVVPTTDGLFALLRDKLPGWDVTVILCAGTPAIVWLRPPAGHDIRARADTPLDALTAATIAALEAQDGR